MFSYFVIFLLTSCEDLFSYHPYDGRFSGPFAHNAAAIADIERATAGKDTLRIAFTGDTHEWYSETEALVADINRRDTLDFVVHGGDLTDTGTTREFQWAEERLAALRKPYIALIGNHDFLGTGDAVYQKMYGPVDFAFIAAGVKFVCLNTNATEYNYMAAVPNFDFMEQEMTARSDEFDRTVVCMHARPYTDQFNNNVARTFGYDVTRFPHLLFCMAAHDHGTDLDDDIFSNGVLFYTSDAANHRKYLIFRISPNLPNGYDYEVITY